MTTKFSIAGLPVYPHIKLTREEYPRLLATRVVKDDRDEYFGAFLSRTSVRILIDFLNRTFRLRSCDIEIDGNFPVPCTQYFAKRCLAPCMASLCTREFHAEIADLARLFLRNERQLFIKEASSRIESLAEALDFEKAAFLRDVLKNVGIFWSKPRWQIWLDDAVDTYDVEVVGNKVRVYLVTQRGRHVLGDRVFEFERNDDVTVEEAVFEVIRQFYTFHLPREIRVPKDFAGRKEIAERLGRRFGRNVKIVVGAFHDKRPTAQRGIERARQKVELESVAPRKTFAVISEQLKTDFELSTKPVRIEAFDIAHISATGFAGGMSVWQSGETRPEDFRFWLSDRGSELDALRAVLAERFSEVSERPDLVLIDGGRSHLNAAVETIGRFPEQSTAIVSAVKPHGRHSAVSHFLTREGKRIEFDPLNETHLLLQTLRDEAHELANAVHRESRDMLHFYERRGLRPLIVPIRYVEKGGHADDLRPISARL